MSDTIFTPDEIARQIQTALGDAMLDYRVQIRCEGVKKRENKNVWITIQPSAVHAAAEALMDISYPHLSCISAFDKGAGSEFLGVQYIFSIYGGVPRNETMVIFSLDLPKKNPVLPTLTDIMEGTAFTEREKTEYIGITISGLPKADHNFFLPQDFPKEVYPLRKDDKKIPDSMVRDLWACGRPQNRPPAPLGGEE